MPQSSQNGHDFTILFLLMRKLANMVVMAYLKALVLSFPETCSEPIVTLAHWVKQHGTWKWQKRP